MKGFMTLKGYMKAFMRLISPFQGFIILRLFFTVKQWYDIDIKSTFNIKAWQTRIINQ